MPDPVKKMPVAPAVTSPVGPYTAIGDPAPPDPPGMVTVTVLNSALSPVTVTPAPVNPTYQAPLKCWPVCPIIIGV